MRPYDYATCWNFVGADIIRPFYIIQYIGQPFIPSGRVETHHDKFAIFLCRGAFLRPYTFTINLSRLYAIRFPDGVQLISGRLIVIPADQVKVNIRVSFDRILDVFGF